MTPAPPSGATATRASEDREDGGEEETLGGGLRIYNPGEGDGGGDGQRGVGEWVDVENPTPEEGTTALTIRGSPSRM